MRILLVENHPIFATTVRTEFLCDHDVHIAGTVAEALDTLDAARFDAVLVDYDLDDAKGDAFIRGARDRGHRTPLIAISAREEGNERMLAAGANATCPKGKFRHIGKVLGSLQPLPSADPKADRPGIEASAAPTRVHGSDHVIRFYSAQGPYGEFSNFAAYPISLDKKKWPTSEHYFQAQKFLDPKAREAVRNASTPLMAARLGRDRRQKLRGDWESVKVSVMRTAVEAKFRQHDHLAKLLLSTGNATLVEHTDADAFWGDGGDGTGSNVLGRILMDVRAALRKERST